MRAPEDSRDVTQFNFLCAVHYVQKDESTGNSTNPLFSSCKRLQKESLLQPNGPPRVSDSFSLFVRSSLILLNKNSIYYLEKKKLRMFCINLLVRMSRDVSKNLEFHLNWITGFCNLYIYIWYEPSSHTVFR